MAERNMSQEFRLENIDIAKKCFIEKINLNEMISKKYEKVFTTLKYIKHLLISASAVTGLVSISAFAALDFIPIGITSSAVG